MLSANKREIELWLQPTVIDSLDNVSMVLQKVKDPKFLVKTKMTFLTNKQNEQAGIVLYRTAKGYYSIMKDKESLILTKVHMGLKHVVATVPYKKRIVYLSVLVNNLAIDFSYGSSENDMKKIGTIQHIDAIADNQFNKFNGTGIGVYATSMGIISKNKVIFDWFKYTTIID
ncbi:MAG: hypothetical protein ACK5NK_10330 [Niabella sp.]